MAHLQQSLRYFFAFLIVSVVSYALAPCPVKAAMAHKVGLEYKQPNSKWQSALPAATCSPADQHTAHGYIGPKSFFGNDCGPAFAVTENNLLSEATEALLRFSPSEKYLYSSLPPLYILYRQLKTELS